MEGIKLANAVRNHWPPIRLIVTSGEVAPCAGDIPADGGFLSKSYTSEPIVDILAELAA